MEKVNSQFLNIEWPTFPEDAKVLVTGIGTSEIHAKFLSYLVPQFKFMATEIIVRSKKEFL